MRLPVPPPRQTVFYNLADKYRDLAIFMQIILCSFPEIDRYGHYFDPITCTLIILSFGQGVRG